MANRDFNHLPAVMRTLYKEEDKAANELARYVASRAEHYAPFRTGRLSSRIRVEHKGHGKADVVSDTSGSGHREYAAYNEYGTRFMHAQPYMHPASVDGIAHRISVGRGIASAVNRAAETGRS